MGYLCSLVFAVAIGNIQFGYAIGGWNVATRAYAEKHEADWGKPEDTSYTNRQVLIQTVTNIGATFGALFGGPVASGLGRWKAIILCNIILLIGAGS